MENSSQTFYPFYEGRINRVTGVLKREYKCRDFLEESIWEGVARKLYEVFHRAAVRCLIVELHICKATGMLDGKDVREEYLYYCKMLENERYNRYDIDFEKYEQMRVNLEAIDYFIENYQYQIKFVISSEADIIEAKELLGKLKFYENLRVIMMAMSSSKIELLKIQESIIKLCLIYGFRYGNRLQLQIWDVDEPKL